MLEFIGILLMICVAWVILKYTCGFIITYFSMTIILFIGIGFIMFILSALTNLIDVGIAWAIVLVPTIIALIHDIKGIPIDSDEIAADVKKTLSYKRGYDERGNEIDFFEGKMCCGNCIYNHGRPSNYSPPRCYNEKHLFSMRIRYLHLKEETLRETKDWFHCEHWEHF